MSATAISAIPMSCSDLVRAYGPTHTLFQTCLTHDQNDIVVTTGMRTEERMSEFDGSLTDGVQFPSRDARLPWWKTQEGRGLEDVVDLEFLQNRVPVLGQKNFEIDGGISNPMTYMQVFQVHGNGLKLGNIETNFKTGARENGVDRVPPIGFAYWRSFKACAAADPELFEKVYGESPENVGQVSIAHLRNVSSEHGEFYRELNPDGKRLPFPQWVLTARIEPAHNYKHEGYEEEQLAWTPKVPFRAGKSVAVAYLELPSIFNPVKYAVQVTGAKGGDTMAMNALLTRQQDYRWPTEIKQGEDKVPIIIDVHTEGINETHDLFAQTISEIREEAYKRHQRTAGFVVTAETYLRLKQFEDLPRQNFWGMPESIRTATARFPEVDFAAKIDGKWMLGHELDDKGYI